MKESPLSLIARTLSAVTHPAVAGAAGEKKKQTQAVQEDDKENEAEEKPAKRRGNVKGRKPRATKAAAEPAAGGRPKRSAGKPKEYWKADAANSSVSFAEESFSKSGTACVPSAVALSPCLLCRVACICGLLESDCFAVALSPCLLCRAACVRGWTRLETYSVVLEAWDVDTGACAAGPALKHTLWFGRRGMWTPECVRLDLP